MYKLQKDNNSTHERTRLEHYREGEGKHGEMVGSNQDFLRQAVRRYSLSRDRTKTDVSGSNKVVCQMDSFGSSLRGKLL